MGGRLGRAQAACGELVATAANSTVLRPLRSKRVRAALHTNRWREAHLPSGDSEPSASMSPASRTASFLSPPAFERVAAMRRSQRVRIVV